MPVMLCALHIVWCASDVPTDSYAVIDKLCLLLCGSLWQTRCVERLELRFDHLLHSQHVCYVSLS